MSLEITGTLGKWIIQVQAVLSNRASCAEATAALDTKQDQLTAAQSSVDARAAEITHMEDDTENLDEQL
jgi:hypothetical protein